MTVGQIIDELNRRIEAYTADALNPDRVPSFREQDMVARRELLRVRDFIVAGTKS